MNPTTKSRVATGLTLILLGLGLYTLQYLGDLGESIVLLALGGLCIGAYLYSRSYLLLATGGIVVGLGIGSFGVRSFSVLSDFSQIGLGVGLILIFVVQLLYEGRSHWWPLIPGVILLLLGFRAWRSFRLFLFSDGWPLILVIIGVLVLLGAIGRGRRRPEPDEG